MHNTLKHRTSNGYADTVGYTAEDHIWLQSHQSGTRDEAMVGTNLMEMFFVFFNIRID